MKTRPLRPARIVWGDDGVPRAPDFSDLYHPRFGAQAQARQVFLAGNGLPQRWAGRDDFTIAETGFGLGNNFLATWQTWRHDAQRPARLHYVALEAYPPTRADLGRALAGDDGLEHSTLVQALVEAWPPLVPGLHRLDFENGAVRLLLAFGDVGELLPELVFEADAFYLDGFAPDRNPQMWDLHVLKALGRRARPGATAATWSVARSLRDGLATAGFVTERVPGQGGKREVLQARFEPRFAHSPMQVPHGDEREVVVVGAGLAGASVAAALAALDLRVTVLDRASAPAQGSSGNLAGLYHATVHPDDGPHARLLRAGALFTSRLLRHIALQAVPQGQGLLRLHDDADAAAARALLEAQGLPADFVQALSQADAAAQAGVPLPAPGWFYPQGGWVSPARLVPALLSHPAIRFVGKADVAALRHAGAGWEVLDAHGQVLARAAHVVLAHADEATALLERAGWPAWPLTRHRGQVSLLAPEPAALRPRLAVAGHGYAITLPDGRVLCGATSQPGDEDPALREADHRFNAERLQHLCGLAAPPDLARCEGRVGWRVQTADRLPLAGAVPAFGLQPARGLDQARRVPREPGLHLACALGSRGLTLGPLLGEVVAARIAGTPLPLEQSLLDAVDPARALVRASRQLGRAGS